MAKYQWIKLDVDIFNNRKIKRLEAEDNGQMIVLIWVKLLVLSAKIQDNGQVYITKNVGYKLKELANELGLFSKKYENILEKSLKLFQSLEMIEIKNDIITIQNWNKYQDYEREENTRKYNAERQRNYRASKTDVSKVNDECHSNVTGVSQENNAIDKDVDVDKDKEEKREDTHYIRREEVEAVALTEQAIVESFKLPKPLVINNTDYRQAPRIKEMITDGGMPYGWFIGKEKQIIEMSDEQFAGFRKWLVDNDSEMSSYAIKKKVIEITTGEIVV